MENSSGKPAHFGKTEKSIQYSNLISLQIAEKTAK